MELFRSLRIKAGSRALRKRAGKLSRKRGFVNLEEVKSVGLLWDISNPDDLTPISDFILQMGERGVKVDVLAFFSGKVLPDKLTAIRYLNCLRREDYSLMYIPKSPEAEKFIQNRFDIVIEICFRDFLPLRYVSTLSVATMKIAPGFRGHNSSGNHELIIETGLNHNVREFLNQVVVYLEMIKTR
ncbi:MAG: hypothetical protein FJY11_00965 [Bacteroidetes bacterium]|nr:hypothetical protein [Bacteroidota bacterium]